MNAIAFRGQAALPWVGTAARLVLAGAWAWAAMAKIADPDAALRAVRAYRLLPETLVPAVGWGLPFLELALAVLLGLGLATRLAAGASAGLLVVFMVGIASAWARGLSIECGCFGGGGERPGIGPGTYALELARDAALLALAVWLTWRPATRLAIDVFSLKRHTPDMEER